MSLNRPWLFSLKSKLAVVVLLGSTITAAEDTPRPTSSDVATKNLLKNADLERPGLKPTQAADFDMGGDTSREFAGRATEQSTMGIALHSARDLNGDGKHEGFVAQRVDILPAAADSQQSRWYRFRFRGMPQEGFILGGDDLHMKVEFASEKGSRSLDGVTKKIYPLIEQNRRDIGVNGVGRKSGAAVWKTYGFEFKLPFAEIDQLRVVVGFRDGQGKGDRDSAFYIDELELVAIDTPIDSPASVKLRPMTPQTVDPQKLIPLGGRWFYQPLQGEIVDKAKLQVTQANAARLYFQESRTRYLNPMADNMSAWLRKGFKDLTGQIVGEDRYLPDNVTITFNNKYMVVSAKNLPNHPTSKFPSPPSSGDRNPGYIQEQDVTHQIPLNPERNPEAKAMDLNNSNRALPMGPTGMAINGVVFFNPFDAGMTDATDLMDRCCGHPTPSNMYHYHKYPVCVKSPFADQGEEHSPLIGWAFDGFGIYGPYEKEGIMAKDSMDNPINEFNIHTDLERGWHYHVTPGKFPYIIGGYWGKVELGNRRGPGPGGPPGFRPPPHPVVEALDLNHDGELSDKEIAQAEQSLKKLDTDGDGVLSREELRPPGGRGASGGGPPGMRGPSGPPPSS